MTTDDIYVPLSAKPRHFIHFPSRLSTFIPVEPRMLMVTNITDTRLYYTHWFEFHYVLFFSVGGLLLKLSLLQAPYYRLLVFFV